LILSSLRKSSNFLIIDNQQLAFKESYINRFVQTHNIKLLLVGKRFIDNFSKYFYKFVTK
jgi:hypothetical protein